MQEPLVVKLSHAKPAAEKGGRVQWTDATVDNEHLGRKSSKSARTRAGGERGCAGPR